MHSPKPDYSQFKSAVLLWLQQPRPEQSLKNYLKDLFPNMSQEQVHELVQQFQKDLLEK